MRNVSLSTAERFCSGAEIASKAYAFINRARGPYEEIFVLAFKAYGPNEVRSMRLECQNKYFLVWTSISVNKSFVVYLHK